MFINSSIQLILHWDIDKSLYLNFLCGFWVGQTKNHKHGQNNTFHYVLSWVLDKLFLTDYRPNYYLTTVPQAAVFFSAGSNPYWRSNFLTL